MRHVPVVERATKKLDGVVDSSVNLATEKLAIEYDEDKLSLEDKRQQWKRLAIGLQRI